MYTVSSGETPKTTVLNDAITLIVASTTQLYTVVRIVNTGAVAGFYSYDGGTTWHYLPANSAIEDDVIIANAAIQVKRITDGSNLTGLYASVG